MEVLTLAFLKQIAIGALIGVALYPALFGSVDYMLGLADDSISLQSYLLAYYTTFDALLVVMGIGIILNLNIPDLGSITGAIALIIIAKVLNMPPTGTVLEQRARKRDGIESNEASQ